MMKRRHVLQAGLGVAALAGVARAQESGKTSRSPSAAERALIDGISRCVAEGNVCLDHCLALLSSGDTSLGECGRAVRDMLAVCAATQALVASGSGRMKPAVQLCVDVCSDCERACRKHESHHAICKACADACAAVIKAGRTLLA